MASKAAAAPRATTGGLLLLAALLAAGCSLPGRPDSPAPRIYLLHDAAAATAAARDNAVPCKTLRIAAPGAAPGFDTARMAYAGDNAELRYFAWNAWADTPARMLGVLAEQRLDASGRYAGVLSGAADIATDLRLELEQIRLLQHFAGDTAEVRMSAKLRLVDMRERRLLGERAVQVAVPAAQADPVAGVAAAQLAATQLLNVLEQFVATADAANCPP